MKLGFQLVTLRSLSLRKGDYFAIDLLANDCMINKGSGRDTYLMHTLLQPKKVLTGTGRTCIYTSEEIKAAVNDFAAQNCVCVQIPAEIKTLRLYFNTNRFLNFRKLPQELELQIIRQENNLKFFSEIKLHDPDFKIEWIGRGVFLFDLFKIYQNFSKSNNR